MASSKSLDGKLVKEDHLEIRHEMETGQDMHENGGNVVKDYPNRIKKHIQATVCNSGKCTLVVCVVGFIVLFFLLLSLKNKTINRKMPTSTSVSSLKDSQEISSYLEYSMFGYNALRGFPLVNGQDPGFTMPIFLAEEGKHSDFYSHSIPPGLILTPDVSCKKIFSSKVIRTRYELTSYFGISIHIQRGGWGISFIGNTEYNNFISELDSGEYVFILSLARCVYCSSKLMGRTPPKLHPQFVSWLDILAKTDDMETYFTFFNMYGTHYFTQLIYGARFTYVHKMTKSAYELARRSGTNIEKQASVYGLYSVDGGAHMDSSQREQASSFTKSVETQTSSIGVPPPRDGDSLTWVSDVKKSPVPLQYYLQSIENLFTEKYTENYILPANLSRLIQNIKRYKLDYCRLLQPECEPYACDQVIELKKTRFHRHFKKAVDCTLQECINTCLQTSDCFALTYCASCTAAHGGDYKSCYMYPSQQYTPMHASSPTEYKSEWVSYAFLGQVNNYIIVRGTSIIGTPQTTEDLSNADFGRCMELCQNDETCIAFSTRMNVYGSTLEGMGCTMYAAQNIIGMERNEHLSSFFISIRRKQETYSCKNNKTATSKS